MTLLCCAAVQSILDHPSAGGIYAASERPPPLLTNVDCREFAAGERAPGCPCSTDDSARMRDLLLQFGVVPTICGAIDAGASARSGAAAPAADECGEVAERKLDGHLSGRPASSGYRSGPDVTRPQLRRDPGGRQQRYPAGQCRVARDT